VTLFLPYRRPSLLLHLLFGTLPFSNLPFARAAIGSVKRLVPFCLLGFAFVSRRGPLRVFWFPEINHQEKEESGHRDRRFDPQRKLPEFHISRDRRKAIMNDESGLNSEGGEGA
jgi:hypothetical protein